MRLPIRPCLPLVVALLSLTACGFGGTEEDPENPNFIGIPASASLPITLADAVQPPDNYPSSVTMTGLRHSITSLRFTVQITHSFPDDIDLLLVGPGGQKCLVMSDCLGTTDLVDTVIDFTHDSASPLPTGTVPSPLADLDYAANNEDADTDVFPAGGSPPPPVGPYVSNLAVFLGTDPNGTWRLYARDDLLGFAGVISWWAIVGTCE